MWYILRLLGLAVILVAGCATSDDREWMKVNERYTLEEFRRDHKACSKGGKLDDVCMRSRGWVDVSRITEKPPEQPPSQRPSVLPRPPQ